MQIYVKGAHETHRFMVDPAMSVRSLKVLLQTLEGFSPEEQRLIFAGKVLQDRLTLSDCNIMDQSRLEMVVGLMGGGRFKHGSVRGAIFSDQVMTCQLVDNEGDALLYPIFIKNHNGKTIVLDVNVNTTVVELRRNIQQMTGIAEPDAGLRGEDPQERLLPGELQPPALLHCASH